MGSKIRKVKKRDGSEVTFDVGRIEIAIQKAIMATGKKDGIQAKKLADLVVDAIDEEVQPGDLPSIEEIQDIVERVLIQEGDPEVAKAYILYREKRKEIREEKEIILQGKKTQTTLSSNALKVLEKRYLKKDEEGNLVETPEQMFLRVAKNIAKADRKYDKKANVKKTENEFYEMMAFLDFLPNSPTLMNAGDKIQQLSACFVLPVEDSMESIFEAVKNTALIHKSGGGTGFNFSRLRPKGDMVLSTKGVSSGPLSFMGVFDAATQTIKQGGKRRGANMGILRVDHPDILEFITAKEKEGILANFNISVGITEKFMKAAEKNELFGLCNPYDRKVIKTIPARQIFDLIVTMAWKNGEPGIVFLDRLNKDNPTPKLGEIESTNPCGEQPLLPYESCNLASINLAQMVRAGKIDWAKLKEVVWSGVHFLDNVIDMNHYPLPIIGEQTRKTRKIGLGVMGYADLLMQMEIPYDSEKAIKIARRIMKFIDDEAKKASVTLARKRGVFPAFKGSVYDTGKKEDRVRNATRTTIAPTGTISMIADCSSGIEPNFAICFTKHVLDGEQLLYINKHFEEIAKKRGFYSKELIVRVAEQGSLEGFHEVPEIIKRYCKISHQISPIWHVKTQDAFQRHTNNAVSKTVNFPNSATTKDVEDVYLLSYKLGCKGVTIYRDGSRDLQVLNLETTRNKKEEEKRKKETNKSETNPKKTGICPECKSKLNFSEGCVTCQKCGYSACSV
ncbi:MAG: vitamin B12-dependent ribonucleotide reductase [Candidatus Altiarchaeota archaeon]